MKKLKKIKLFPLTDFDSLSLPVASEKHFDFTVLPQEDQNKALAEIFKMVGSIPEAIIATKMDGKTFVNTQISTSKQKSKTFTFPEPNPVCIYYSSANNHLQNSYSIKNKIYREEQHFDQNYHYQNFIEYFRETSEGIILLSTTLEAFINQLLDDNLQLTINNANKNKSEIEWLDIVTKIRQVIPQISGIDFFQTNPKEYSNITQLIDLRNDLIHLKKSTKENVTNYQALFKRLVELNHIEVSDSVFNFINVIMPNYLIEDQEQGPENWPKTTDNSNESFGTLY